jgi:outer membrane protein OmpA-like peptidoglycan-associated protein
MLRKTRADAIGDVFISLGIGEDKVIMASLGSSKANKNVQRKEDGVLDRRCDALIRTTR